MQDILNDFCQKMAIKSFADSTQRSYRGELIKYLQYCNEHQLQTNSNSFQEYLYHLVKIKKLSECSLKQSIGAVKFFFATA